MLLIAEIHPSPHYGQPGGQEASAEDGEQHCGNEWHADTDRWRLISSSLSPSLTFSLIYLSPKSGGPARFKQMTPLSIRFNLKLLVYCQARAQLITFRWKALNLGILMSSWEMTTFLPPHPSSLTPLFYLSPPAPTSPPSKPLSSSSTPLPCRLGESSF